MKVSEIKRTAIIKSYADDVLRVVESARVFLPKRAKLLRGKYAGRLGKVDGLLPHPSHGLVVLVMVYRHNSKDLLNSDGESRSYWPLHAIEFVEE